MSYYRKFKSLANEKDHGYAYDSSAFETKAQVDGHFRMYQTYGDGLTQHSSDWTITREYIADYLASFAVAMLTDEELLKGACYSIGHRPGSDQIAFAASVVYQKPKDDKQYVKPRYFSLNEMKVSSSDSKRHDKRYEEVREFHDGSAKSIFRILIPEYADGLMVYAYADAIREWALEDNARAYTQLPGLFLEWTKDHDAAQQLHNAYTACWNLVQAYQLRHSAEAAIDNYKRRAGIETPPASEAA